MTPAKRGNGSSRVRSFSSVGGSNSFDGMNGYNTVMCGGTPSCACGSNRRRQLPTVTIDGRPFEISCAS